MGLLHGGDRDPEFSQSSPDVDPRRLMIAAIINGIRRVQEGSMGQLVVSGPKSWGDPVVTADNAQEILKVFKGRFGEEFPALFVAGTAEDQSTGQDLPSPDIYEYPYINAHAAVEGAWAGQPNSGQ